MPRPLVLVLRPRPRKTPERSRTRTTDEDEHEAEPALSDRLSGQRRERLFAKEANWIWCSIASPSPRPSDRSPDVSGAGRGGTSARGWNKPRPYGSTRRRLRFPLSQRESICLSCACRRFVAQVSNLLYRGFPIRLPWHPPASPSCRVACRMEFGDTADWKSALRQTHTRERAGVRENATQIRWRLEGLRVVRRQK